MFEENAAFSHIIRDSFTMIFNLFAHLLAIILGWVKLYYSPDDGQSVEAILHIAKFLETVGSDPKPSFRSNSSKLSLILLLGILASFVSIF